MNERWKTTLRRVGMMVPAVAVTTLVVGMPSVLAANGHASSTAATATSQGSAQRAAHQPSTSSNGSDAGQTHASDTASSQSTSGNAGTSGDVSQPQPVSNADQNSGGANGQCPGGPYCSTRDGSPSGNGNGNGAAVGKPCAGCVGKADNKNPQGQFPDGSDANNGYECDGNHGIGRTNPAHTGCTTPPITCDESTGDCGGPGPCESGTTTEDCDHGGHHGGGHHGGHHSGGSSGGKTCASGHMENGECVLAEHHHRMTSGSVTQPATLAQHNLQTPAALPFTGGGELRLMALLALAMPVVGFGLLFAGRRRVARQNA